MWQGGVNADPMGMLPQPTCDTFTSAVLGAALDVRPIYTIDEHNRIAAVNEAWLQFTRRWTDEEPTADEVVGHSVSWPPMARTRAYSSSHSWRTWPPGSTS